MNQLDLNPFKVIFHPLNEGAILIHSTLFTILYVNPKLERILGYTQEELIGKSLDSVLPISRELYDLTGIMEGNEYFSKISWQTQTKTKETIDIDFTIQIMDLGSINEESSSSPGEDSVIVLLIQDTTSKRALDRTMHFTQNLLRAIREIKQSIFLNQEPQEIIETTCASLRKARNFDVVWGVIFNEDGSDSIYASCKGESSTGTILDTLREVYQRSNESIPINAVCKDPFTLMNFHSSKFDNKYNNYYGLFGVHDNYVEALSFQISWNDHIYGALELVYFKPYPFAADDIHILQELGNDLGFAFYNRETEVIKTEALRKIEYQGILLDTIDIPILSSYKSGTIRYANTAAERRLNYSIQEMLDSNLFEILNITKTTMEYIKTRTVRREIVISNPRTDLFPAVFHSSPIMGRNGEFLGIMIVVIDITHQKEQEIHNRNLDRLLIESAKFASLGEMAAGIAHEINNPLQSSLLYLEDLIQVDEEDPEERKKILKIIESANLRIKTLVRNLLDLGKNQNKEKDWVPPRYLVERVLDLMEANTKKNHILLTSELEPDLPNIFVYLQEIEQVIINCVMNAINALSEMQSPPERKMIHIAIFCRKVANRMDVLFSIEDNGPGIDPKNMDRLFYPLFTTRKNKNGTGLGLAISKKIVNSYGGSIQFDPQYKKGSRIEFNIPVA